MGPTTSLNRKTYHLALSHTVLCALTTMINPFASGYQKKGGHRRIVFSFVKGMVNRSNFLINFVS